MASPPLKLDLTSTFGITLIGQSLSCIKDSVSIRIVVLVLLVLDSAHQALIIFLIYHYLIINFANPLGLLNNIWSIGAEIILNAAIAFIVESFLVVRIWLLSANNVFITFICGTLTVAHLVMNLVFPIKTLAFTDIQVASWALKPIGTGGLSVAVITDVCISGTLCFYLQRARTPFSNTNDIITKLIRLTVATDLLTTAFVLANLIALIVAPDALYSIFFNFQLAKLYINALLTSLNARDAIRNTGREAGKSTGVLNSVEFTLKSTEPASTISTHVGFTEPGQSGQDDVKLQQVENYKISSI